MPRPIRPPKPRLGTYSWLVICDDSSHAYLGRSSREQAINTANELFPGWLRLELEGEW